MKKIIMTATLLLVALVVAAVGITLFCGPKQADTPECYTGEEARQTLTCKKLATIPEQTNRPYPIVCERNSMFDFSTTLIFEANAEWIDTFIREQKLVQGSHSGGLFNLSNNFKVWKQDAVVAIIDNDSWTYYTNGTVQNERPNGLYIGHFDAYINAARNKVMLNYHSFTKAEKTSE